ncbi:MAG: amidohydrolase [Eubacteriaceae bacterium]|nr:amidohydrolase [Eubacteriaceae bacterium]
MADLIIMNAAVYTMDDELPRAEAVAVENDKIIAVGNNEDIMKFKEAKTEVVDANGGMVLPGFIDAHCHPTLCAFFENGLYIDQDLTVDEILAAAKKQVEDHPEKNSYFGIGYNECFFDEKGPTKELLDEICSDKPIFFLGSSGHEGWCNSKTLELANVTKDTKDPLPGFQYFERDEKGEPTGHIVEVSTETILFNAVDFFGAEEIYQGYIDTSKSYSSMGVTTTIDCGAFEWMEPICIPTIEKLVKNGDYKQRLFGSAMVETAAKAGPALEVLKERSKKYNSDKYRVNTYKIILDGTLETRTASLSKPYDEDGRMVEPLFSGKKIEEVFLDAAYAGFDINAHAIGDKAIHESLRGAAAVRNAGIKNVRIGNSHTEYVQKEDRKLFGEYDVVANTSGVWHYGNSDLDGIIGERAKDLFTMKDIIEAGGIMTMGSDRPVDEVGPEPLRGIEIGMTRKLAGVKNAPVLPPEDQKLSLQECLKAYTCNAAYQVRMEEKIGRLKEGMYADIVVLEKDLFDVPAEEIHDVPIEMTVWNGETVYKK